MRAPTELYDDRDSVGVMCMRCGLNRRPKRKNRAEVASAAERLGQQGETLAVSTHHHLCSLCYQADRDAEEARLRDYLLEELMGSTKRISRKGGWIWNAT